MAISNDVTKAVEAIMSAFSRTPNFEIIINTLITGGIDKLAEECSIRPGVPLRPMLAHPARSITEIASRFECSEVLCEFKYDGERVQIHCVEHKSISIFSRNMENLSEKYPDIVKIALKIAKPGVTSFIIDCEAVAWDKEANKSLPFQTLSTRKRRDVNISNVNVAVCIFAFDLLYLNDKPTIELLHNQRRSAIISSFNFTQGVFELAEGIKTSSVDDMEIFFKKALQNNCEGLIIKSLNDTSTYKPTVRTRNWIKIKKDYMDTTGDTFDLVPIAAYAGHGKRSSLFGGYLLAIYNSEKEVYQSVCKIGTGFTEKCLQELQNELLKHKIEQPKLYYEWDNSPNIRPDVWFNTVQVWEVKAADISLSPVHKAGIGLIDKNKGISLRFPRFLRVRDDKGPTDSTSEDQLADMYRQQLNRNSKIESPSDECEE